MSYSYSNQILVFSLVYIQKLISVFYYSEHASGRSQPASLNSALEINCSVPTPDP